MPGHAEPDAAERHVQTRCNAYKQTTVAEKKLKVAINGFGRIGRQFLRCWHGRGESLLDVVVINDSGGPKQASHLLKYDSTFGTFDADVKVRALCLTLPLPLCRPRLRTHHVRVCLPPSLRVRALVCMHV